MSGRNDEDRRESARVWLQGVLVVVVIAGALGLFGSRASFERPKLGPVNIIGILIMFGGLALTMASGPLAEKLTGARDGRTWPLLRFCGILVCCVGATMVFI